MIITLATAVSGATAQAGDINPGTSSAEFLLKEVDSATLDLPVGDPFTLQDALTEAYRKNPEIQAARAGLRATDESHAQAASGFRPSATGEASYETENQNGSLTDTHDNPKTLSLQVTQSIYSGGSTKAAVLGADSRIRAQRALLQSTEQRVLLRVVTAYMNVLRDQEVAMLTINNETVLANQLRASRERFRLGDTTITDIKQAETRLADAIAARIGAQGNLKKSRAGFESVVWVFPGNLLAPDVDVAIPASLDAALGRG